jgi:ubiquinone/menaquinone biosynthesis C-methylase UbiE
MSAKTAAASHWGAHPCGAAAASGAEEGSARFFDLIDTDRYQRYAPWLPEIARFERFAGQDLLEIGCGLGTDLACFARAGARVTGIDLVPRHLALTRQRFQLLGLDARLELADAERLPYPDASFDAIYSFGVLHHTPEIGSAIAEMWRVLRPGGPRSSRSTTSSP